MNRLLFTIILLMITLKCFSCKFGPSYEDRRIYKSFSTDEGKVEWYAYTSVTSDSPFFITIENEGNLDTVCITTNIKGIDSININTVRLIFCSSPKEYDKDIKVPTKVKNWNIIVDTTCPLITH